MSPLAVSILVFLAAATLFAAVGLIVRDLRTGPAVPESDRPVRLERRKTEQTADAPAGSVAAMDNWFIQLLRDAGLDWDPTATTLLVVGWGVVCGAALFLVDERVGPAVTIGLLAAPLPVLFLVFHRARRMARLQDQVPPALETLARSMRAGCTLEQAIKLVGEHSPQPLAAEFRWCARQMEMGLSVSAVMRSLVERVRLYDTRILATTLIVHRQTGGNVVTVLERLAQVIRERLNYRRQLRATTAAGRMSAGLVALVAPGVFAYFFFFRPDYVNTMLQTPLGQAMLLLALFLEVVGLLWTARLLRPAY